MCSGRYFGTLERSINDSVRIVKINTIFSSGRRPATMYVGCRRKKGMSKEVWVETQNYAMKPLICFRPHLPTAGHSGGPNAPHSGWTARKAVARRRSVGSDPEMNFITDRYWLKHDDLRASRGTDSNRSSHQARAPTQSRLASSWH